MRARFGKRPSRCCSRRVVRGQQGHRTASSSTRAARPACGEARIDGDARRDRGARGLRSTLPASTTSICSCARHRALLGSARPAAELADARARCAKGAVTRARRERRGRAPALDRARLPAAAAAASRARPALLLVQHAPGRVRALRGQRRDRAHGGRGTSEARERHAVPRVRRARGSRRLALRATLDGARDPPTCLARSVSASARRAHRGDPRSQGRDASSASAAARASSPRGSRSSSASASATSALDRAGAHAERRRDCSACGSPRSSAAG